MMKCLAKISSGYLAKAQRRKGLIMNALRLCALVLALIWLPFLLVSQSATDTAQILPALTVRDIRFERTGYTVWKADTLPLQGSLSLADRLLWEAPLTVRANAPGTLATLSVRGAGPSRTPVFWNGLNLQSPMNGVVDASLIPTWSGDRLEVRYGGQSAALSSGAMGGSILIESDVWADNAGFSGWLGSALGSFRRNEINSGLGYSGKKIATQVRATWQKADNDFPFRNTTQIGQPDVYQVNNFLQKTDVQQFNRLKINEKNILKTAAWHQQAFREIPPAMTEARSETWQRDRANRAVLTWENAPNTRSYWLTRVAWLDEFIAFRLLGQTDTSRSRTLLASTTYTSTHPHHLTWKAGLQATLQTAQVDGYADTSRWFSQRRAAAFAMAERQWRKARISLLVRQELAEGTAVPFTGSIGGQFRAGRVGAGRFHVSRNFNLPTLNDRHWRTLGNSALLSENGYSADAGWHFQRKGFSTELSVFQLIVDNWILWQPGMDGQFRPGNLRKVWSRGVEWNGHWQWQSDDWRWKMSGRYQFTKATNVAIYSGEAGALHRELPYTPKHTGGLTLSVLKGRLSGAYLHQFTGHRFVTSDNATVVRGFSIGNLLVRHEFSFQKKNASRGVQLTLDARLENVWNTPYQVLAYRPMPGRAGRVGIEIRF